jgi:hypothetical protein
MPLEVRYRGQLLGHWPTESDAKAHIASHMSKHADPENITIAPMRPLALLCHGSLVDTFDDEASTKAAVTTALVAAAKSKHKRVRRMTQENFQVVSTATLITS